MHGFAATPARERADAIQETAARLEINPVVIEKDFWVCWVLRELFALPGVGEHLMFKGGTSLSKAYAVLDRFSEDIDVSIHPHIFGLDLANEWPDLTKSQRQNRVRKLNRKTRELVTDQIAPQLRIAIETRLHDGKWSVEEGEAKRDLCPIHFHYPRALSESAPLAYARPEVLIEISARAEHEPTETRTITPYVGEEFPRLFTDRSFDVKVLAAKRTFWEKATILHAELNKPAEKLLAPRLARHAYDLFKLHNSEIGEEAFASSDLLQRVCEHKAAFYPQKSVNYKTAYTGALRIVPEGPRLAEVRQDYASMRDFFLGDAPPFDAIVTALQSIQDRINQPFNA